MTNGICAKLRIEDIDLEYGRRLVVGLIDPDEIGRIDVDMFLELDLPDYLRSELIDGDIVLMSPSTAKHGEIVAKISYLFQTGLEKAKLRCKVFGDLGVRDDEARILVGPDVSVVCDQSIIIDGWCRKGPELVVEVLHHGSRSRDLGRKREIYKDFGTREYWVVDVKNKCIIIENFESGEIKRFWGGSVVESFMFECFKFEVNELFGEE
jgi:Uma2 family endonuclease